MSLKNRSFAAPLLMATLAAGMAGCRTPPKVVQLDAAGHGTLSFSGEQIFDQEIVQLCRGQNDQSCETYQAPAQTIPKNNPHLELQNPEGKIEVPCTITPQPDMFIIQPIYVSTGKAMMVTYIPEYVPQPDSIACRIDLSGAQRGQPQATPTQETHALTKN